MDKKELLKKEFEIDRKIYAHKKTISKHAKGIKVSDMDLHLAQAELPALKEEIRAIQRKLYGWRFVEEQYEKMDAEELNLLRRRVAELELKETEYKRILAEYKSEVKRQEQEITRIKGHLGIIIGWKPTDDDIKKALDKLMEIHKKAGIAEIGLPIIQEKLKKARAALGQALKEDKKKKQSADHVSRTHASPGEELDVRAKTYMSEYQGTTYVEAVVAVLDSDLELAAAYIHWQR